MTLWFRKKTLEHSHVADRFAEARMGNGEVLRQKASCEADRALKALATARRLGEERKRLRALSVEAWTRAIKAIGACEEQRDIRQQRSTVQWVPRNCSFAD